MISALGWHIAGLWRRGPDPEPRPTGRWIDQHCPTTGLIARIWVDE